MFLTFAAPSQVASTAKCAWSSPSQHMSMQTSTAQNCRQSQKWKKDTEIFFLSFLLLRHLAWLSRYIPHFFCLPLGSWEKFLRIRLQLRIFLILQFNHYSWFLKAWVLLELGELVHRWQGLFLEFRAVKTKPLQKAEGGHSFQIITCLKYSVDII